MEKETQRERDVCVRERKRDDLMIIKDRGIEILVARK